MKSRRSEKPVSPPNKAVYWAVALTAAAALVLLLVLARDILGQLKQTGGHGGASSTRLLTGLFVVMCFAGFTAAALWSVGKKLLGKNPPPAAKDRR